MRKLLSIIIMLLLIVTLQGCRNSQSSNEDEKDNNSGYNTSDKATSTPTIKETRSTSVPQEKPIITPNRKEDTTYANDGNCSANALQAKPASTPTIKAKPTPSSESNRAIDDRVKVLLEQKAKDIFKNSKLELTDEYKIISTATGDLDLDEFPDLAVVVEKSPGSQKGLRTLYVLMQNADGNYTIKHANQNIILGRGEGGVWGDPFQKIEINNKMLVIHEYGGSNFRWEFIDQFKFIDGELRLVHSYRMHYYTGTGNGYQIDYDYIDDTVKYTSCSPANKNYNPKLIYSDKLNSSIILFDLFDIEKYPNAIEIDLIDFFPSLGWYEYDKYDKMIDLKISSNKALDLIKDAFKPDMEKVEIPWTAETKANYSSLICYAVPDYYYKKGNSRLYYYELNDMRKDQPEHTIIFKDENKEISFYRIDDLTGEVKKKY